MEEDRGCPHLQIEGYADIVMEVKENKKLKLKEKKNKRRGILDWTNHMTKPEPNY